MSSGGYRGYVSSRPIQDNRVPQHVQNLVIRDHASRLGLPYRLSAVEYCMDRCHMMLHQVLDELPGLDGIIFYSLFQLPIRSSARREIYDRVLDAGAVAHFAVERLAIATAGDVSRLEDIWHVQQAVPLCPTVIPEATAAWR